MKVIRSLLIGHKSVVIAAAMIFCTKFHTADAVGTVRVATDRLTYTTETKKTKKGAADKVEVTGFDCESGSYGSGKGKIGGAKVNFTCLKTGFYEQDDFAITCGIREETKKDVVCQAFYKGSVSTLLECSSIADSECVISDDGAEACEYDCTSPEICDAFPGIQWFLEKNLLAATTGKIKITPKKLIVGEGTEMMWRKVSGYDLCWYGEAIQEKCLDDTKNVVDKKTLLECAETKFKNWKSFGWITKIDAQAAVRAVSRSNIYSKEFLRKQAVKAEREAKKSLREQKKIDQQIAQEKAEKQAQKREQKKAEKIAQKEAKTQAEKGAGKKNGGKEQQTEDEGTGEEEQPGEAGPSN